MHTTAKILLVAVLLGLLIAPVAADTVIVHTNDVHGRLNTNIGYDGLAAYCADLAAAGDEVVLLSAGDDIQGLVYAGYSEGEAPIRIMNAVGYQAMALGNHEFDYGADRTAELADIAEFPFLAANIFYEGTDIPVYEPHLIVLTSTVKIGIFGITMPGTTTVSLPVNTEGLTIAGGDELYAVARAEVAYLRDEGCDFIVALCHLGTDTSAAPDRSTDLAEQVDGIDLLIDGHSHLAYPTGLEAGSTLIVSTGADLENIGEVRIAADGTPVARLISDYTGKDPAITAQIDAYVAVVDDVYGEPIGTTAFLLNGAGTPGVRTEETNLGDFVADAFLWKAAQYGYSPVAALIGGGSIRTSIEPGEITKIQVYDILPFINRLSVAEVTGQQLLTDFEANTATTPEGEGGFPQVAGIVYHVDTAEPYVPGEIHRVTIASIGGTPFDAAATYQIVSIDYTFLNGDKYTQLGTADWVCLPATSTDAVIDYLQSEAGGIVPDRYASTAGRITVSAGPAPDSAAAASPVGLCGLAAGLAAALVLTRRH